MSRQGFLFSEPSVSETGVWCELNSDIDPAQWASVCRQLGQMSEREFRKVSRKIHGNPDSLWSRLKRLFTFNESDYSNTPLLSFGPSGINGQYQIEYDCEIIPEATPDKTATRMLQLV